MIDVNLVFEYGFPWNYKEGIYFKGAFFSKEDRYYIGEEAIDYIRDNIDYDKPEVLVSRLNGFFTVIIENEVSILLLVDKTRTFPIFYKVSSNGIMISDSIDVLKDNCKISPISLEEFYLTGYTTMNTTLFENIYQVEAGVYVKISKSLNITKKKYFSYTLTLDERPLLKREDYYSSLKRILEDSIKRLIQVSDNRQIVVPLSGGYDSRFIATSLKKMNYNNVICYTYGKKDSFEVKNSKEVADKLGFDWYFIEYNDKIIPNNFTNDKNFIEYSLYGFNFSSVLCLQDYFAINKLRDDNVIEKDSIIVPGHTGDFISGNHLRNTDIEIVNIKEVNKRIFDTHYINGSTKNKRQIKERINKSIREEGIPYSVIDSWNYRERQSKFIINSITVYLFNGYQVWLPLWDSEIISFFKDLPFKYKINGNLYIEVLMKEFFLPFDVGMEKKAVNMKNIFIKKIIKKIIPNNIRKIYRKYKTEDFNNFELIVKELNKDTNLSFNKNEIDEATISWCLYKYIHNEKNIKKNI